MQSDQETWGENVFPFFHLKRKRQSNHTNTQIHINKRKIVKKWANILFHFILIYLQRIFAFVTRDQENEWRRDACTLRRLLRNTQTLC